MNILIVNTFDIFGGAARAAYRLHKGLIRIGMNAFMLVKEKQSQDEKVLRVIPQTDESSLHQLEIIHTITEDYIKNNRTDSSLGRFSLGYPGYDLTGAKIIKEVDLINLHWVDGFLSVESISSLLELGKPIVWTLHDVNPFTGGCHYPAGCTLFKDDCRLCPQLIKDPYNLPQFNLKSKISQFRDKNLTIVTPSKWMAKEAKHSAVFKHSRVVVIPNSIETDIFTPQNKKQAKGKFDIAENTVTILTGASRWKPKRKGFEEFLSAMKHCLDNKNFRNLVYENRIFLLCFGSPANAIKDMGIPYKSFGRVRSDPLLSDIYNAADLFLLPSTEDNLPNTMVEAMSCGIPVIAFNTGGMPDMIRDGITGRLVPPGNTEVLAQAIIHLVFHPSERTKMGEESRRLIEGCYKLEDQAENYARLFKTLLPAQYSPVHRFPPHFTPGKDRDCRLDHSFNPMLLPLYRKYDNIIKKNISTRDDYR